MKNEEGGAVNQSFPRTARLLNKSEFSAVFSKAKPYRDAYFTVLVRENNQLDSRLGMVVAKKKCKLAVDRHRLKRIIRESFRRSRSQFPHLDIVILPQVKAAKSDKSTLNASLLKLWGKIAKSH